MAARTAKWPADMMGTGGETSFKLKILSLLKRHCVLIPAGLGDGVCMPANPVSSYSPSGKGKPITTHIPLPYISDSCFFGAQGPLAKVRSPPKAIRSLHGPSGMSENYDKCSLPHRRAH